ARLGVDASWLTLARESRHIVAFGLLGTTSRAAVLIPHPSLCSAYARARLLRPARAKGFCEQGILTGSRAAASRMVGARRRGECDDGNDLDRRSRRTTEKT